MQSESHPHSHNQGPTKSSSRSKEGFSVYGLFHHLARTPQGKFLLRQYFLRPSLNPHVINERLETIGVFLRPENTGPVEKLVKNLQSVKNIRVTMINLRKGVGAGLGRGGGISRSVWAGIRQVCSSDCFLDWPHLPNDFTISSSFMCWRLEMHFKRWLAQNS
jgi:DNA mismatch repair protein MSH5